MPGPPEHARSRPILLPGLNVPGLPVPQGFCTHGPSCLPVCFCTHGPSCSPFRLHSLMAYGRCNETMSTLALTPALVQPRGARHSLPHIHPQVPIKKQFPGVGECELHTCQPCTLTSQLSFLVAPSAFWRSHQHSTLAL